MAQGAGSSETNSGGSGPKDAVAVNSRLALHAHHDGRLLLPARPGTGQRRAQIQRCRSYLWPTMGSSSYPHGWSPWCANLLECRNVVWYVATLFRRTTCVLIGGTASPYLLSLGLSKSSMAIVFVAGPLSGLIMQPLIGSSAPHIGCA